MRSNQTHCSDKRLRVLQIVGDPVGGIRKHLHSLLMGLDEKIFRQYYVYSTVATDARFRAELPLIKERLEHAVYPLKIKKKPGVSDLMNIWKLRKIVIDNHIDIIHGHGAKGGLYSRLLGKLCRVKVVYTPHGGSVHKMFNPFEERLYTLTEKLLLRSTDYVLFESKYAADGFCSKIGEMPKKWSINYNGISPLNISEIAAHANRLKENFLYNGKFNIGVFGMMRTLKGQKYAIEAVSELLKNGESIDLHLFGEGSERLKLEQYVKALGLTQNVFFYGEVPEVEPYMYRMDLVVIPSLFESFPYTALEAYALKKPLIASKVGGLVEIIDDNQTGFLVEPGNPFELAEMIKKYINSPALKREHSEKGFQRFNDHFSEDKMLTTVNNIYLSLFPMQ